MYRYFFDYATVMETKDTLVRLLRIIFYKRGITTQDFVRLHGDYWSRWNRDDERVSEATHRNNQRRATLNDKISWAKFVYVILELLRLDIVRVSVTLRDRDGIETVYASDDVITPVAVLPDEMYAPDLDA